MFGAGFAVGGAPLFDTVGGGSVATLWGENVLTVLDTFLWFDGDLLLQDNAQFAINIADWIAEPPPGSIPEPTTLLLLCLGLAGIGFTRRRLR